MDQFGIPNKIVRHVIKAIENLVENHEESGFCNVFECVEFSTRNLVPVTNLEDKVQKSLSNLEMLGIVTRDDFGYNVTSRARVFKNMTKFGESRTRGMITKRKLSEDSLSGDEFSKPAKRLRTHKKLDRVGSKAVLPKIRKSKNIGSVYDDDGGDDDDEVGNDDDASSIGSARDIMSDMMDEHENSFTRDNIEPEETLRVVEVKEGNIPE